MKIQADVVLELDTNALQYMEPRGDLVPIASMLQVILGEGVKIAAVHHFSVVATESQFEENWWAAWLRAYYAQNESDMGVMPFDGDPTWAQKPESTAPAKEE